MSQFGKNIRKIAIVGTKNPSAQLELAKKRLEEVGMGHIEVELLTPEDFKFSYEPPEPIMVIDEYSLPLIEDYPFQVWPKDSNSGSKFHK